MRISDWSSDVCSSDLLVGRSHDAVDAVADDAERVDIEAAVGLVEDGEAGGDEAHLDDLVALLLAARTADIHVALHPVHRDVERVGLLAGEAQALRSEEHTSELTSLMSNSLAVFCLNKKK